MKKLIAILAVAVLLPSGLGGVAYAAEPVNEVHVAFQTLYEYHAPGDSFTNASVSCQRGWNSGLRNEPDDSGLPVKDATLTLASEHKFDRVNPEPKTMGPPSYEWFLGDIPEGFWGELVSVGFYEDLVPFTPGFDASRSVDRTEFLASGTQTLTITVTARQSLLTDLNVIVNALEDQYVNPTITLPITGEADEIHLSDDGHQLFIGIYKPVEGHPYTFQVNIEVVLKSGVTRVEFMPKVNVHSQQEVASDTTTGSSITHTMAEVGTWTCSATGTYHYGWQEAELGVIWLEGYSRVNNKVQAQCSTHYHYLVLEDTFENQPVEGKKDWCTSLGNWVDETHEAVKAVTLTLDSGQEFGYIWPEENLTKTGPPTWEWSFGDVPEGSGVEGRVGSVPVTFTPGISATRAVEPTVFSEPGTQTLVITVTPAEDITNEQLVILVDAFDQPQASSVITEVTAEGKIRQSEHHVDIELREVPAGTTCTATIKIQVTPKVPKVEFIPQVAIIRVPFIPNATIMSSSVKLTSEIGTWTWRADGSYEWEVNTSEWIHRSLEWSPSCREIVNKVQAQFVTNWIYDVPGDTFTNGEVSGYKLWAAHLRNHPDETRAPVTSASLRLDSELKFDHIRPEENLTKKGPPTYEWFFGDIPEGSGLEGQVSKPPVAFTPGFDASRSAAPTQFTEAGTQTLTMTLTPRQEIDWFHLYLEAWEDHLVNPVITSPTTDESLGIWLAPDGHHLDMHLVGLTVGKTYTYYVTINVTPKVAGVPAVKFMPQVHIDWPQHLASGTTSGSSVSQTVEQLGTWTWSAEGSYLWDWSEDLCSGVFFLGYSNILPVAQASVDLYLAPVGSAFAFDGSASADPDGTIVSYDWDFDDGSSGSGALVTHTYAAPGLYNVVLTVTDDMGAQSTDTVMVVVYDPEAGFATGGGWFIPGGKTSDLGDMLPGLDNTSPANFGFVVKYKPGATNPDGQLEFQYRQGDFNLHSSGMEWLVIVNNNWAKFHGTATIKGLEGIFPFRVDARDGDFGGGDQPDRFIIKIWAPGADPDKDELIYKASGDLEGGNIVIHAKK